MQRVDHLPLLIHASCLSALVLGCAAEPDPVPAPVPCTEMEYATVSRDKPGDVECNPLTVCASNEYEILAPTYSSDRRCEKVQDCEPGQRVVSEPTTSSDRVCAPCDLGVSYSDQENAADCQSVKACTAQEFIATAATLTNDRMCGDCASELLIDHGDCLACVDAQTCTEIICDQGYVLRNGQCAVAPQPDNSRCESNSDSITCVCDEGYFGTLDWEDLEDRWRGRCSPWTNCAPGTFVSSPGNATEDRQCQNCTAMVNFSSGTNAITCTPLSDCRAGQFVQSPPTLSSDRVCASCVLGSDFSTSTNAVSCATLSDCVPGQFVLLAATLSNDRTCASCTLGSDYSNSVNATSCLPLSNCSPGEYVATPASVGSDRTCASCTLGSDYSNSANVPSCSPLSDCSPGEYIATPASVSSDRTCASCALGSNFSTSTNAVSCATLSDCSPGQFILNEATVSSDRVCDSCTLGSDFSTSTNAVSCATLSDCSPGQFILNDATVSSDRVCDSCTLGSDFSTSTNAVSCANLRDCNPGQFVLNEGTVSSDRVCNPCTLGSDFSTSTNAPSCDLLAECSPGEYVFTVATVTSNRICQSCTAGVDYSENINAARCAAVRDCGPGEYVLAEGTVDGDRVCESCILDSSYSTSTNAPSCSLLSDCLPGEFVSTIATLSSDRSCSDCSIGVDYSGSTNANACASVSDCNPGEYVLAPPTRSSDRFCESCTLGIDYSNTGNATQCSLVQSCASNEYELTPPTVSSDRVCEQLLVQVSSTDAQAYEGGLDSAVITVSLSAVQGRDVAINYVVSGSAEPNSDYLLTLNGSVLSTPFIIPAGQVRVDITVEPVATNELEVAETVAFALANSSEYELSNDRDVSITIVEYGPSNGNVYFVDENGNNSNVGDEANPFGTIAYAVTQLSAGDTLYIKDGTYTNSGYSDNHGPTGDTSVNNGLLARITSSGTPDNWITIAAYPDGNDIRPLLKFDGTGGIQFNSGANYIRLEGLEIEGPNAEIQYDWAHDHRWTKENFYTGRGIYSWGPVHHIVVENCNVHHTPGSGIRFNKADYILVQGNIVSNTTWWSTSAESAIVIATAESIDTENVVKFLYSGNVVYNNWNFMEFCNTPLRSSTNDEYGNCDYYTGGIIDGQGLYVTRNNTTYLFGRMRFENNIAFNNGFGGVVYHKTDRGELINNLVFMNGAYPGISNYTGMTVNTADDLTIINNVIWARDGNDYGLKNNGNASNVVTHNNYIVGRTQFGTTVDNEIIDFSAAEDFDVFFTAVQDISLANPVPTATTGATAPANIDALVQGYNLDFSLRDTALDLIDTGTTSFAPSVDRFSTPRPQGNGVDIGPHERAVP